MANNKIQVKRTSTSGRTPNTTNSGNSQYIDAGELALNMVDGILYSSNGSAVIEIGSNNTNQSITNSLTISNDKQLRFKTVNTSAYAYFVQQSDDNFVFYTTNASYAARPIFSIYANSSTSDFQLGQPVTFNGSNVKFSTSTSLYANGSAGSSGQVLTSNGSTLYWSTPGAASVNTAYQWVWSNTQTFQANVAFTGNNISVVSNTGSVMFGGASDTNWRIGRSTGSTTKFYYTNNSLDILAADSNLEGVAIGKPGGNTYLETGYAGTFTRNPIYVGNTSVNVTINSTSFSGTANNASYLGGVADGSYLRSDASDIFSGGILQVYNDTGVLGSTTGAANTLQIFQGNVNADAFQTFHISGDTAVHFGLDGTTNDLFVGGWSFGANKYKVWHQNNDGSGSGLDADLLDGSQPSALNVNSALTANNSSYLGGVAAASYVQNTDSRTLSGNLYFTGANVYVATSLYVGDNSYISTTNHFVGNSTVNTSIAAGSISVNGAVQANNSGLYPASNSLGTALGNTTARWVINSNTINASGLITGSAGLTISAGAFTASMSGANFTVNSMTTGVIALGGPTQTGAINLGVSTANQTVSLASGATTSGNVKTLNIGTAGAAGSTTNVNIGTALSNSFITINANTANINGDSTILSVGNSSVYTTINSTAFSGSAASANNSSYLGGVAAASYIQNTDSRTLSGNLVYSGTYHNPGSNTVLLGNSTARWVISANTIDATGNFTSTANVTANNANTTYDLNVGRNLTVTGNLTVSGNVTIIGANNLSIVDNMIYLNSSSTTANPDIGIAANYNDGTYRHTGIFRDASDGIWKVFDSYTPEPDANVYIDTTNTSFQIANFQANTLYLGNTSTNWLVANGSGAYHTGTINAASHTVGSNFIANSSAIVGTGYANITTSVNSALLTVGTSFIANTSGVYHTGIVNAATIQASATFTANSTLVNAAAINITGQTNTATLYVTTSANVGTLLQVNTSAYYVASNSTVNTIITATTFTQANTTATPFVANASGLYHTGIVNAGAFTTTGNANAAVHYAGANVYINATAAFISTNSTVNTIITATSFTQANTTATPFVANVTGLYHTGVVNAGAFTTTGNSNAAVHYAGANVYINATAAFVSTNSTVNTIITATSFTQANTTATPFVANVTGLYHTGVVNAAAFTTTGNANAAVHYAGANVYINATAAFISTNSTVNTIITATSFTQANTTATPFVANATGLYHTGIVNAAAFTTTGNVNAAVHYAGSNVYMNATTMFVSTNSTMNTVISANQITLNGANVITTATVVKVYYANGVQAYP